MIASPSEIGGEVLLQVTPQHKINAFNRRMGIFMNLIIKKKKKCSHVALNSYLHPYLKMILSALLLKRPSKWKKKSQTRYGIYWSICWIRETCKHKKYNGKKRKYLRCVVRKYLKMVKWKGRHIYNSLYTTNKNCREVKTKKRFLHFCYFCGGGSGGR